MCAAAAAAAAFVRGRCFFGGAAACSSADDPSRVKSSCGWGWERGRRYLSQSLPIPDHNLQNKILPEIQIQKQKAPWLMLSSQDGDDGMPWLSFNHEIDLTQIASHKCVGSSQGFLITVDRNAEIHAINPIAGGRLSLPSTATLPNMISVVRDPITGDIEYYVSSVYTTESPEIIPLVFEHNDGRTCFLRKLKYDNIESFGYSQNFENFGMRYMRVRYYRKLILSPSLDTAVAFHAATKGYSMWQLAFAQLGGDHTSSSSSWIDLPSSSYFFEDIIFHNGQLHEVDVVGTLSVYDMENPSAQPFCSPEGPLHDEDTSFQRSMVESPDGDDLLFLVYRDMSDDEPLRTQGFKVFKLDKSDYKWNQIDSVGDLALFVGFNHTMSLSARDFHGLKPDCIYFTDEDSLCCSLQLLGDTGVYNLKDGSIQFFQLTDGPQDLNWPPAVWFMPAMC